MCKQLLEEWIAKADEDFEAAVSLVRKRKQPTPNAVCFHCQQSAEKYLKAFLTRYRISFPRTHDLLLLHALCLDVEPRFAELADRLDELNPYSVDLRYPGEDATVEEAKRAVKVLRLVKAFVQRMLSRSMPS